MTPNEASKMENSLVVWYNIYGAYLRSYKFKAGQTVRISKYKSTFDKGYLPNYTEEFFRVKKGNDGKTHSVLITRLKR